MAATPDRVGGSPTRHDHPVFDRSYPLEGIEILSRAQGGDGRTVDAYAAVFGVRTEVHDRHGHYIEEINRSAFNRTLANGAARRAMVLYNHGRGVVDGTPDSLAQVPIGSPVDITADSRGLRTVTRYNRSTLADSVLEAIRNDDIRGYSFRGGIYRSSPSGQIPRVKPGAELPVVTRMELGLSDYGPTPMPCYEGAAILAVRSIADVASVLADLSDDERQDLIRALGTTRSGVSDLATATPSQGPGAEDPRHTTHSGRSQDVARQRELAAWAELAYMEMAVQWQSGRAS